MGKPAARLADMHVCPMITVLVPHVGGPIVGPGAPTVLIGSMPAATMTSMCVCVGPPDVIMLGSTGVFLGGLPAARMGDITAHGGTIAVGLPTVLIGEIDIAMLIASLQKLAMLLELEALQAIANTINDLPFLSPETKASILQIISSLIAAITGGERIVPVIVPPVPNVVIPVFPPENIETDKIACKLVDQDNNPVEGEKCEIILPNGSIVNAVTDKNGEVKVEGFEPGLCKVSFPDIHADEWDA